MKQTTAPSNDGSCSVSPSIPDGWKAYSGARVLVTGGLGFVGSNVARALYEAGARVCVLDDGSMARRENLADYTDVEIIIDSVTDPAVVRSLVSRSDFVFHLACRNIIASTREPFMDCQVNVVGTVNVLLAARDAGVRRVVYASSASVYGNPRLVPIAEEGPMSTLNPYAASKYAGENYCVAYHNSFGIPVTALRYSNVYGPLQRPDNPYCGVVSIFMDRLLKGETIRIFGDGEQTRDYTYIDDVVEATLNAGLREIADGKVYNVGTGRELSVNQLAKLVIAIGQRDCPTEYAPPRDIDMVRRRVLSTEKIRRELGWSARTLIEEGLRRTFGWLRDGKLPPRQAPLLRESSTIQSGAAAL